MLSFVPLGPRLRVAGALFAAGACVATAVAGIAACLTVPPPDVNTGVDLAPQILHPSVSPPTGLLTEWPPQGFVVPVRVGSDGVCEATVYDRVGTTYHNERFPPLAPCPTSTLDGGVVTVTFSFVPDDPGACQDVIFTVAHGFSEGQSPGAPVIVPDTNGGDQATWQYRPGACLSYDAGALGDGAFPETGSDGLVVPEGGGDP